MKANEIAYYYVLKGASYLASKKLETGVKVSRSMCNAGAIPMHIMVVKQSTPDYIIVVRGCLGRNDYRYKSKVGETESLQF